MWWFLFYFILVVLWMEMSVGFCGIVGGWLYKFVCTLVHIFVILIR